MPMIIRTFIFCCLVLVAAPSVAMQYEDIVTNMSDEQKAAQILMVYFTSAEFALKHEFGGVLLSANAFKNQDQLRVSLSHLQQQSKNKLLVALDHEGGKVNRLKGLENWEQTLSAKELGTLSVDKVKQHAEKAAVFLAKMGVNLNLAPVLDPLKNKLGNLTWIGKNERSFGNAKQIILAASAYIQAFKKHDISSITKHFPGYLSEINSDVQMAEVDVTSAYLDAIEQPFRQLANISGGTMMASHAYESGGKPAVLSSKLVSKARSIYPNGLILTDDLWVNGVRLWGQKFSDGYSIKTNNKRATDYKDKQLLYVTKEAIKSGCDVFLITYPEKAVLMKKEIVKWMQNDQEIRDRVESAIYRIIKFKVENRIGVFE